MPRFDQRSMADAAALLAAGCGVGLIFLGRWLMSFDDVEVLADFGDIEDDVAEQLPSMP